MRHYAILLSIFAQLSFGEQCSTQQLVANDQAFATVNSDGSVSAWGNSLYGGSTTYVDFPKPVKSVIPLGKSMAAISKDGKTLFLWGELIAFADWPETTFKTFTKEVEKVVFAERNLAVLFIDGTVDAWGMDYLDEELIAQIRSLKGVKELLSTNRAFCTLQKDGTVFSWGSPSFGGRSDNLKSNAQIQTVYASDRAFVAVKSDGSAECWGYPTRGGDCSNIDFSAGIKSVHGNTWAFTALMKNGSIKTWGDSKYGGDALSLKISGQIDQVKATSSAFAIRLLDGSVHAWGNAEEGGSIPSSFRGKCNKLYSTAKAFACTMENKSIFAWGHTDFGGEVPENLREGPYRSIHATESAFAGLTEDGLIRAWGNKYLGGLTPDGQLKAGFIVSGISAFSAVSSNGSIHTWGSFGLPKDIKSQRKISSTVANGAASAVLLDDDTAFTFGDSYGGGGNVVSKVKSIVANTAGMAILKLDGSVKTLGRMEKYAVNAILASGVSQITSAITAFGAVKSDGRVVTWGTLRSAEVYPEGIMLSAKAKQIFSTNEAFAVVLEDGQVQCMGILSGGGDCSTVSFESGVKKIYSNDVAFAAVLNNGKVVTWGSTLNGGTSSNVKFSGAVIDIVSSELAFAAILEDQTVVGWGAADAGIVPTGLAKVKSIVANRWAFAAIDENDTVTTWGNPLFGGSTGEVDFGPGVIQVSPSDDSFAALRKDGVAVAWPPGSSGVNTTWATNVVHLTAGKYFFIATQKDGRVKTWGSLLPVLLMDLEASKLRDVESVHALGEGALVIQKDGKWLTLGNLPSLSMRAPNITCSPVGSPEPTYNPTPNPTTESPSSTSVIRSSLCLLAASLMFQALAH